jgi:soluble lytic murein transglycosylase-like protein
MTEYRTLVDSAARTYGIDANLIEAVVIAESSGRTDAFRFEPAFYERYLRDKPEYAGQIPRRISSSYGLMQVMYTTACGHGFQDYPELLFKPEVGLKYGCLHLAKMLTWADRNVPQALAGYNGGMGNWEGAMPQRYARHVLEILVAVELEQPL